MKLRFLGAAGGVTGSRSLVTSGTTRILVDCGMFQGFKENRLRNWDPLEVGALDAVVLTHAHIDHSGWVPALVRQGYAGPIYCTAATRSLLEILWPDAGRIQEEDARRANERGSSRHTPALPMYTEREALAALKRVVPVENGETLEIGELRIGFQGAGHILGAASVLVQSPTRSLLFSGDLGRPDDAVVPAPLPPPAVDAVVLESTYGDRFHPTLDRLQALEDVLNRTFERGGMVLVPTFAVGRAQGLLWALHTLMEAERVPRVPIVLDSPMAARATRAFLAHPDDLRLTPHQLHRMTERVEFPGTVEESRAVGGRREPFVLLAASGMLTGGRVLHHLAQRARTKRNTLLFVGFQAPGTRGGRIVAGERTIRVFGEKIPIRCEVEEIGGFSAHADAGQLHAWLSAAPQRPRVFLNHGEPAACDALRLRLQDDGYDVTVAAEGVVWDLEAGVRQVPPVAAGFTAPRPDSPLQGASLVFGDGATVGAVRAALDAIDAGLLPALPVVVRGEALGQAVRQALGDQVRRVHFEPG